MTTLTDWMKGGQDAATCLSAPGAAPLTYAALRQLANEVQHSLNAVGIGRNDRVALVLPNSAEMAASFVTVAACCTSAPLNPSYRADEFEFYLNDLNAKALVVEAGSGSASIEVARK
jgi:acyl-CoA synthetase (AMP-forming)/AMP-acid ligase II